MMTSRPNAVISWSGGKDSCLAYLRTAAEFSFSAAVTMLNEDETRSRSHGLRPDVIEAQVDALGLQWIHKGCSWSSYESAFVEALNDAAARGATHLVCGDILYLEHKAWIERVCQQASLAAVEPLWGSKTVDLYDEFLQRGGRARIVAVDARKLTEDWLYRPLSREALADFARLSVDPCGENGEYHTLVTMCPAFRQPLAVEPGSRVLRNGYWAIDVQLATPAVLARD